MSDIVVVGKVGSMVSEWNSDKSAIFTRVTIDVAETVRGTLSGRTVTVVVPGGEIGDDGEWYSHTPRFTAQEEVVLFAGKAADGTYRVSGGEQGKLTVERDRETGVKVIPNVGSLQAFTGHLRSPKSTKEN
jgi:hypothetical protein